MLRHPRKEVLYIGYGSISGKTRFLGVGIKRSVSLPIDKIDLVTYSNDFNSSGVCFGDSGGPGLIKINGQVQIVSVTSASFPCEVSNCYPCSNGSKHTRIDRFADWIASIVGDRYVYCNQDIDRCACPSACTSYGICDNSVCGIDTCSDIIDCIFIDCADSSDGSCRTACIDDGNIAARDKLDSLVDCWAAKCRNVKGSANQKQCLINYCSYEWGVRKAN